MVEPRYAVGAHETFAFRTGWLKKGYDAVRKDRFAFARDDAVVQLGVGKNMVRSIRFWCLSTGVLEEEARPTGSKPLKPTEIGNRLLADDGWDPYLEDSASLWLVHWLLVTNPRASAWWYAFGTYPDNEFSKPRMIAFLQSIVERQQQTVSPTSLARDVDCFVRTYVSGMNAASSLPEASFDCPLAELELIHPADTDGVYRFRIGRKEGLPPQVVGFALLQFFGAHVLPRRSVNLRDCLYAAGSPGQAFRLDEDALREALDDVAGLTQGKLHVAETAGVAQVFLHLEHPSALHEMALALLDDYYCLRRKGDGA